MGVLHCDACGESQPQWLVVVMGGRDRWFEYIAKPPNDGLDSRLNCFCSTCVPATEGKILQISGEMNHDSAIDPARIVNTQFEDSLEQKRMARASHQ